MLCYQQGYLLDKFKILRHFAEEVYAYVDSGARASAVARQRGSGDYDKLSPDKMDDPVSARLRLATAARKWGMDWSAVNASSGSPHQQRLDDANSKLSVKDPILDVATAPVNVPVEVPPPVSPIAYKQHHLVIGSPDKKSQPSMLVDETPGQGHRSRTRSRSTSGSFAISELNNDESIRSRLASKDAQDIIREDIYQQLQDISKSSEFVSTPMATKTKDASSAGKVKERGPTESMSRTSFKSPASFRSSAESFPDYLNVYLGPPAVGTANDADKKHQLAGKVLDNGISLSRVSSCNEDWNSRGATQDDYEIDDFGDEDIVPSEARPSSSSSALGYLDEHAVKTVSQIKLCSKQFLQNSSLLHKYDIPGARVPSTGVELKAWPWQLEKDIAYERLTGVKTPQMRSYQSTPASERRLEGFPSEPRRDKSFDKYLSGAAHTNTTDQRALASSAPRDRTLTSRASAESTHPGSNASQYSNSPNHQQSFSHPSADANHTPYLRSGIASSFSPAQYYTASPNTTDTVSSSHSPADVYSGAALRRPDGADAELWIAQNRFDEIHTSYIVALKQRDEVMKSRWNRLNANLNNTKV